ncbi:MAG: tRNA pseudouridine(55) synthase TruB [Acidobacteriota bacterium]
MSTSPSLDGVLLIDKPSGPTSHDVVARLRRVLGQRSIGHTGTLDPLASGLLALVVGRATRLASILTGSDKTYEATIRLGFATTTDDALGSPLGSKETGSLKRPGLAATWETESRGKHLTSAPDAPLETGSLKRPGLLPGDGDIRAVLEEFTGTFQQVPPAHSAKKVGGVKAYELARRSQPVALTPVTVTVRSLEWTSRTGDTLEVLVTATAGFYVRALARDLGARLGCGGHLTALRRVRSGAFSVDDALPLADAERAGGALAARLLTPAAALPQLAAVTLTEEGLRRVLHGNWIGPAHWVDDEGRPDAVGAAPPVTESAARMTPIKLLAPGQGRLVALAKARSGALHPVVVLG